ncbi:MAG TPA: extracellular solute-binding protein [Armatimonadetes bacterium]|nr:extracellular solute-binding protein [Armatimonadota bacterium]
MALSCKPTAQRQVVVYTSLDRDYAEPILKDFERQSGIRVLAVYDTEATKTTGLVNRLIAERKHPRADVFWSSEVGRTVILKRKGILQRFTPRSAVDIPDAFKDRDGFWVGYAVRARVIVYNTKRLRHRDCPKSIFDLTDEKWRGKVAIANPMFGTTSTHVAALFCALGEQRAMQFFQRLKANKVGVVEGNSIVRDRVATGEYLLGLTDTDDVWVGRDMGQPDALILPDQHENGIGTLVIPNTIALIANCPHPEEGKALMEYLLSPDVEQKLALGPSRQLPVRAHLKVQRGVAPLSRIKAMKVDYDSLADWIDKAVPMVKELLTP